MTRYREFGGPDDRCIWIQPSAIVRPTAADYFAGRDTALEAITAAACG